MVKVIDQTEGENWKVIHSDCVEVARGLPDDKLGFTLYSPPFESLYVFSDSERDMSNCADADTFWTHYRFLIKELYRATMPGRIVATHCMQLPTSKLRDGFIGLRDFRGDIIRAFQAEARAEDDDGQAVRGYYRSLDEANTHHCREVRRAVGDQHISVDGAKKAANDAWAGTIRFHLGEKFMALENARAVVYTCSRSSIKEGGVATLGQTFTRCEIEAVPCMAVRERESRSDRDER